MKRISIRQLHANTGQWVRQAAENNEIIITDRGQPVAALVAFERTTRRKPLPNRWEKIKKMPPVPDSGSYVSEMRDRL